MARKKYPQSRNLAIKCPVRFGAREEKYSPRDKDKFDPYRYRFGLVDHGDTGRYLFGARYYEPTQRVWTQQDSLDAPLDPVNANRYAYAGADPINNYDPTGNNAWATQLYGCAFVICLAAGPTHDTGTGKTSVDADVKFGAGLAAGLTSGWTEGDVPEKTAGYFTSSCSGAYGFGGGVSESKAFGAPLDEEPDATYFGEAGLGVNCTGGVGANFPIN